MCLVSITSITTPSQADVGDRLVLYFPVSALVTLFANILQNPQDPRARADVKLMNLVVNFLSMLTSDEENGSVRRMLGICAEFERIAKVVLDKAEKDGHKRKRKAATEDIGPDVRESQSQPPRPRTKFIPAMTPQQGMHQNGSINGSNHSQTFSPRSDNLYNASPNLIGGATPGMLPAYDTDFGEILAGTTGLPGFPEANQIPLAASALNPGAFQQPFVPQDLWQMPMTLEWDWADMTQTAYGSYDNPELQAQGMQGMPP